MKFNKNIAQKNIHPVVVWSLICAIAIVALLTVFIQVKQSREAAQNNAVNGVSSKNQTLKEAIVALDFGNGKVRRFKGPIDDNAKVWDLFQQAIAVGGISVEVSDHFVPRVIDGIKDGAGGKHWNLYVNNVKQQFTPFDIQVKPGDEVTFKFE